MVNFRLGEDAALVYAAALDSVTVVNSGRPEGVSEAEWFDTVKRNKEHLKVVLSKPLWDGSAFDLAPLQDAAYRPDGTPPAAPTPRFVARDLVALLTADDYANIAAATTSNPAMGLLWSGLLAQGDAPILVSSERFIAGLAGLKTGLGTDRVIEIFNALGIEIEH